MDREDEEDAESSHDIPSFEDLVRDIEQQNTTPDELGDEELNPSGAAESPEGLPSSTESDEEEFDSDEGWQWADTQSKDAGSESNVRGKGVDNLWDNSGVEPDLDAEADSKPEPDPEGESSISIDESKSKALVELVQNAPNILMAGPTGIPRENELCSHLTDIQAGVNRSRLLVTTEQSVDDRLNSLKPFTDANYNQTTMLVVGDQVRSNNSSEPTTTELNGESITIESLTDPRDLTRLGVMINKYMSEGEEPPVLCFHTLNEIARFVGIEKLFRFLHILQSRVKSVGGHAHYHIDPKELENESLTTLKPLFDFSVSYDATGSISLEPRS